MSVCPATSFFFFRDDRVTGARTSAESNTGTCAPGTGDPDPSRTRPSARGSARHEHTRRCRPAAPRGGATSFSRIDPNECTFRARAVGFEKGRGSLRSPSGGPKGLEPLHFRYYREVFGLVASGSLLALAQNLPRPQFRIGIRCPYSNTVAIVGFTLSGRLRASASHTRAFGNEAAPGSFPAVSPRPALRRSCPSRPGGPGESSAFRWLGGRRGPHRTE